MLSEPSAKVPQPSYPPSDHKSVARHSPHSKAEAHRILVIDDMAAIHEDFRKILQPRWDTEFETEEAALFGRMENTCSSATFQIDSAFQGQEGFAKASQAAAAGQPYAVAFVDVRMPPGWDGIETASRLWEADADLQIVICTAYSDYSWAQIIKRLGHRESLLVLKKPFDNIEVLQLANALARKWQLMRAAKQRVLQLDQEVERRTEELRAANFALHQEMVERKRVQEDLGTKEQRWRLLFNGGPDAVFVLEHGGQLPGRFIEVNDIACKRLGYSREEFQRMSPADIHDPEDVRMFPEIMQKLAREQSAVWESVQIAKSGQRIPVEINAQLFQMEGRDVHLAIVRDITERKRSEQAIRGSEEQFRSVWEHSSEALRLMNEQGLILDVNPAYCELVHLRRQQLIGQSPGVAYAPDGAPTEEMNLTRLFRTGGLSPRLSTTARLWDDQPRDLEISNVILHVDQHGKLLLSTFRDITDRRRAERRTEAFAHLAQRLSGAKTAKSAAQVIVKVADQLFGWDACTCDLYSQSENLVTPVLTTDILKGERTEFSPSYDHVPPQPLTRKAIEEGAFLLLRDEKNPGPSDSFPIGDTDRRSASLLFAPIRSGGEIIGVLSIQSYKQRAYDQQTLDTFQALADHCGVALERLRGEERLRLAEEQLRQSQKLEAIGQLAGGVAHDFNNLLAVIRGNTDLMQISCPELKGEPADFLEQIAAASERAADLTRQLLAFSRKQVMQAERVDLNELVGNLTKMLKRIIGEDIRLQCNYGTNLAAIHADPGMLEQVLVNLVVNARDAMPHGGQLVISTETRTFDAGYARQHPEARAGKYVTLTVTDSGEGITAEHLPHIFEPFFTTKAVGKGTGLGLSTVYGIIKQHEGWVEVTSEPDWGASFTVALPATDAAPPKAAPSEQAKPRGGHETVLLVEDEDSVRYLTRRVLLQYGYKVIEAASGPKALALCEKQSPAVDLLLTDVIMPDGMTGRQLAEKLRGLYHDLKVIFTSGYSGDNLSTDQDYLSRTNSRFLPKPATPRALLQVVREVLDRS